MKTILVLDVETMNNIGCPLVYDIGWRIIDTEGHEYESDSFTIRDTFVYMRDIMKTAYYANKIPEYITELQTGQRKMINFMVAWRYILKVMKKYNCTTVAAYNCMFDKKALNNTLRYISKSECRFFFPFSTEFICIWNMACNTICQEGKYKTFSETYRHYSNKGRNYRSSAEVVYAYLTNNPSFEEAHKGLDDVNIECEIFLKCFEHTPEFMGINPGCWQKVKRAALVVVR